MGKSKLGISVALLSAICWLLGYYGGYTVAVLAVGYVLVREENEWLKKSVLKLLVLMLAFSLANTVLYLLPTVMNLLYSFLEIFKVSFYLSFIDRILNFFSNILSFVKMVLFMAVAFLPLLGKEVKLPLVDDLLDKLLAKHAE